MGIFSCFRSKNFVLEKITIFSCFRSDDLKHSPVSSLMTFDILTTFSIQKIP